MARYSGVVLDSVSNAPVAGALVFVTYQNNGPSPVLTNDDGSALANPVISDDYGQYSFNIPADAFVDLAIYYGSRRIAVEYGVPVGNPYLQFKGDPGAAGNVAIGRGSDAAGLRGPVASAASPGDVWALSEVGRDGSFRMTAGVPPFADTYQGMFVVVDGTKYWSRIVDDGRYQLSWWVSGTDLGEMYGPLLDQVIAILPSGARLAWGQNRLLVRQQMIFPKSISIEGVSPDVSGLENAPGNNWLGNGGLVRFRASRSGIRQMDLVGAVVNANASQPGNVQFFPADATTPMEDLWVERCRLRNTCEPVTTYGVEIGSSATEEIPFNRPTRVRVVDNEIITCRYGSIFFNGQDVTFARNKVRPDPYATSVTVSAQGWTAGIRVLGAKNVQIYENDFVLLNYAPNASNSALRCDAMAYSPTLKGRNSNILFQNNKVSGGSVLYDLSDFDTLTIGGNVWINDINDTKLAYAFFCNSVNESPWKMGDVVGVDEAYIGVSNMLISIGGGLAPSRRGRLMAGVGRVISNKRDIHGPDAAVYRVSYPVFSLMEVGGLNMLGKPRQAFDFLFEGGTDFHGTTLILRDAVLAERSAGGVLSAAGVTINGGDPSSSMTFVATVGATDYASNPDAYRRQPPGLYARTYG